MYSYSEYFELTPEHILQKISQEKIFTIFFENIILDAKIYKNPLRDDNNGMCYFEYYDHVLLFKDFADSNRVNRSCFRMIMDKFNLTLSESLLYICSYFNLSTSSLDYKQVKAIDIENKIPTKKRLPINLSFIGREMCKGDRKYWSKYLIYPDQLEGDHVFCVESFSINNKNIIPFSLTYAYTFPIEGKLKIYSPLTRPEYKWVTNCDNNVIGNIHNIEDSGNSLVVTKSYKDSRVLRNLGLKNVVWFQNEGQVPSDIINIDLINRFKNVVFIYDNDKTGIEAGEKLSTVFNEYKRGCARSVHLPVRCKWKDPSDFISHEGRIDLIKQLKQMKINGIT